MPVVMFDSIDVSMLPPGASAYAGYVGGRWPTFPKVAAKFPNAHLLSIAVNASEDADVLDVEAGDATVPQVPVWFRRQVARGLARPVIYISQGRLEALTAVMASHGVVRSAYRVWSAHYSHGEHMCSPAACGAQSAVDGTQWTYTAQGKNLDQSLMSDGFFGVPPASSEDDEMASSVAYWDNEKYLACVGTDRCIYYMGPETSGKWHGIAGSHVKSGVSLAVSAAGEKTIFYTNAAGQPCMYVAKPGTDTWVWARLPGNVM